MDVGLLGDNKWMALFLEDQGSVSLVLIFLLLVLDDLPLDDLLGFLLLQQGVILINVNSHIL